MQSGYIPAQEDFVMGKRYMQNGHNNYQFIVNTPPKPGVSMKKLLLCLSFLLIFLVIFASLFLVPDRIATIYIDLRNLCLTILFDSAPESDATLLPADTPLPAVTNQTAFTAASSSVCQLQYNDVDYSVSADMAVDGNLETAWNEGAPGLGIGEWICLQPSDGIPRQYTGFRIANGFQYHTYDKKDRWTKNCRVSLLDVYGDNVYIDTFSVADNSSGYQELHFREPVYCLSLKFVIKGVYEGTDFSDACISEIQPF